MVDKTGLNSTAAYVVKVSAFYGDCKADCQKARRRFLAAETRRMGSTILEGSVTSFIE
jgi:hypothetical protein